MVKTLGLIVFLSLAIDAVAQNYSPNDTVTEYPLKGTYYHNKFEGRKTSSGEIFDQNLFTAAHWKIKLGTYVLVTNRNTGLQVIVKVNDRCPKKGVFDMTRRAAHSIGIKGCQPVTVRLLEGDYSEQCEAQDSQFDSVPSRYASGALALKATTESLKKETGNSNTKPSSLTESKANQDNTNTIKNKKKVVKVPNLPKETSKSEHYNLILGVVKTYGEAYDMIKDLPEPYQEKTIVDAIADSVITITLDVKLSKKKAQELNRALKHTFKNCKIAISE